MKIRRKTGNRVLWLLCMTAVVCIAGIVSAASAVEWQQFQVDNANSGVTGDSAPITNASGSAQSWVRGVDTTGWVGIDNCPIVGGGKVFAVSYKGKIQAYYLNGTLAWENTTMSATGNFELATPAYSKDEEELYVALCDGSTNTRAQLYAFDADDGTPLWEHTDISNEQTDTPITLDDNANLLFFGTVKMSGTDPVNLSDDGTYYCYNTDGVFQWSRPTTTGGGYYWAGAAIVGDSLVYGDDKGWLFSVNKTNGTDVRDSFNVSDEFGFPAGKIRSSIAYNSTKGSLYFTSQGGYCFAVGIDASTGNFTSTRWSHEIGYSTSTPALYGDYVYVGNNNGFSTGTLYCLDDTDDGAEEWSNSNLGPIQSSPAVSDWYGEPYIYVTTNSDSGGLYCVNRTLNEVWHNASVGTSVTDYYCLNGAALAGGRVFYGNDGGYLHALAVNTTYDFLTKAEGNAYGDAVTALPTNASAPAQEFSSTDYNAIKADDDTTADCNSTVDGQYAAQRFRFKVLSDEEPWVSALGATWIGTGTHDSATNGTDFYIWNDDTDTYTSLASTTSGSEVTLAGSVTSDVDDYIDGNGYVTLLVKQKSAQTTGRETYRSYLETDYVKMEVVH